jgi:hypothetical protein
VGIDYRYDYRPRFAGSQFDDAFFAYLRSIGREGPPDLNQLYYNANQHNVLDVGPTSLLIDASDTERWLEDRARTDLGVASSDYTVFLVNWWNRPDFEFHVYQEAGRPDPDTGLDNGAALYARLISWGGTSGRSWFLDLSAGPEYWGGSMDVDLADISGDGVADYRFPPIWEYGNDTGYRPFDDLTGDLVRAVRYIALDVLFTASPLFDPAYSAPGPGGHKVLSVDIFEGDHDRKGVNDLRPEIVEANHQALEPYYPVDITVRGFPLNDGPRRAFEIASGRLRVNDCWNQYGHPLAELYCWFDARTDQYFPTPANDHAIRGQGYTVVNRDTAGFGFSGLTDDNWQDGSPSFVYMLDSPGLRRRFGIAYTHLTTHEAGHYVGLSHGHDGYDPATNDHFYAGDGRWFLWLGDESHSDMSYLHHTVEFSAFERDNMNRWQVARLLNRANADAKRILDASNDAGVASLLRQADQRFGQALDAYDASDWLRGATLAAQAYALVQRAARRAGVTLEPSQAPASAARVAPGPRLDLEQPHPMPR